uniref:Structure specific recognition protein 1a n=1 Tax=Sinocyclocheilus grahami TaxID=75366 RepID=A0A672SMD5_SINGR
MGDTLEFNNIHTEVKGSWNDGRLRFGKQSVVYKSHKTGKVDSIPAPELSAAQWRRVCLGHGIKLATGSGDVYRYDGFRDTVREPTDQVILTEKSRHL